ncbi:hypothetical protein MKQ68_23180 [Chitinophaga horti]|uniref:Zinc-finger domain-containing protein n=1 Tax=Chitinophaga horti TaxID=2920382 RepID=A0ABY6J454_9BACT|nr:hypothetical protein [Chitinophaga horti]UYQ92987.1 hypothetical protein MKQ68_23180 [Chitinophaga horti]
MDINISNYEEYLLSYIDGELAGNELAALKAFLERHPAIKQELTLLESTRLKPEESGFSFGNKAMLYRGGPVNMGNYETYLLSYIDNELSPEDRQLFEQFVRQHPQVKQEMLLWNATRQHPDTSIVFENKALLYRQTTRTRTLRPVYWWSAAAAIVAGLLVWQLPREASPVVAPQVAAVQQEDHTPAATPEVAVTQPRPEEQEVTAPKTTLKTKPATNVVVAKADKSEDKTSVTPTAPLTASVSAPEPKLVTTEIVATKPPKTGKLL